MAFQVSLSRSPRQLLLGAAFFGLLAGTPALAQKEKKLDDRVERLEKEMQAVQRKVFPGGAGQVISPDIQPVEQAPVQVGTPASTPLTDLIARVGSIEGQQARQTGQVEEAGYRIRQLEDANKRMASEIAEMRAQIAALTGPPPAETAGLAPGPMPLGTTPPASSATRAAAQGSAPAPAQAVSVAAADARLKAIAEIPRPNGSSAQDEYVYGYRLWNGKFYPEAQVQLQATLDKFPNDPVASRTANLLGRAYLDDGKPTQAAKVLFENYRARPKGERAAESLAWVGTALIQLKRPKDACLAYEELAEAFAGSMPDNVRDMMAEGRKAAKCGG